MNEKVLKIWCNNPFLPVQKDARDLLIKAVGNHRLRLFEPAENGRQGEAAAALRESDIVFGSPDAESVASAENIRWIHLNSAGYTNFDRADIRRKLELRGAVLTNSSAVFEEPCAQHLAAMILSFARGLPFALDSQYTSKNWEMHKLRARARLLNSQTGLIYGFGTIGRRLAELLKPFGLKLTGVRRKITGTDDISVITPQQADEYLPVTDHVINILPENRETINFFDSERFFKLKPSAFFYNIGRGTTVDQLALREMLEQEKIAAAYLDVTDPEPLPPEDPLWTTRNCFITPHIAGGTNDEKERQVRHFLENLRRFTNNEPLLDLIIGNNAETRTQ